MPRPFKHQKSGVYYFRQRIPTDLHSKLGNKIVSRSLRTKDPAEAKLRNANEVRRQATEWEAHRKEPSPLPLQTIVALSGEFYRDYAAMLEAEPGEPKVWEELLALLDRLDAKPASIPEWHGSTVDDLLLQHSLVTDEFSRNRLITEMHRTMREAAEHQLKRAQGDFSPDPNLSRFPSPDVIPQSTQAVATAPPSETKVWTLFKLWEGDHIAEGKSATTVGDFRQKIQSLVDFVGHDDASRLTSRNIIDWCDLLRNSEGLAGITVKGKYLAAARAVFTVGKTKQRLKVNPTDGVHVRAARAPVTRSLGFTDDEAQKILTAALVDPSELGRRTAENKRAIRWGPWLPPS